MYKVPPKLGGSEIYIYHLIMPYFNDLDWKKFLVSEINFRLLVFFQLVFCKERELRNVLFFQEKRLHFLYVLDKTTFSLG